MHLMSLGWFQGLVFTGIWVIAHECGHQASALPCTCRTTLPAAYTPLLQSFSESKTINNSVGWVLHSALLVPYHAWRITHAQHHAATGHMTRDQVFVPKTASDVGLKTPENGSWLDNVDDLLEDAPLYVCINLMAQQLRRFATL